MHIQPKSAQPTFTDHHCCRATGLCEPGRCRPDGSTAAGYSCTGGPGTPRPFPVGTVPHPVPRRSELRSFPRPVLLRSVSASGSTLPL